MFFLKKFAQFTQIIVDSLFDFKIMLNVSEITKYRVKIPKISIETGMPV